MKFMILVSILASLVLVGSISTSYVLAEVFTTLEVSGSSDLLGEVGIGKASTPGLALDVNGVSKFNKDLIFARTDGMNSIVQSQAAFDAEKHLIYQKAGGGAMSKYIVRANQISLNLGDVGIGTENPLEKLDVRGNIRLTGDIISPNDICIGSCP